MNQHLTLALALLTASFAFGDELPEQPLIVKQQDENHYAHTSLDYDIFWAPTTISTYYPAYNEQGNRIRTYKVDANEKSQYEGVRITWDWLKPNSFYAGANLWFARGNIHNKVYLDNKKIEDVHTSSNIWINYDFGLGYSYKPSPNSGFLLSLFAGPGYHFEKKYQKEAQWKYGMAGFKIAQDLTKSLKVGVDFKTMYTHYVRDPYRVTFFERKGDERFWGIELGTPVTWHFGEKRRFDVKVKPYLLKLNLNSNVTILGATMGFGYTY